MSKGWRLIGKIRLKGTEQRLHLKVVGTAVGGGVKMDQNETLAKLQTVKLKQTLKQRIVRALILILPVTGALFVFQNCSQVTGFSVLSSSDSLNLETGGSTAGAPLQRISNLEYQNSLTDAVTYQFQRQGNTTGATTVFKASTVLGAISSLPGDTGETKLGTDQTAKSLSTARFTAYTDIANSIAIMISKDLNLLKAFAGSCVVSNTDLSNQSCVNSFISNFGQILYRTPVKPEEQAELANGISSWRELIGRMMLHPRFLVHIEREGQKLNTSDYQLTAYELEARLASVFWKSVPDLEGLKAAASGSILTPEGLKNEVARMLNSPKAKNTLWIFYQQWFAASRLPLNYDTGPGFRALASPLTAAALNQAFRNAVLADAKEFLEYHTWSTEGTLEDIFRSPLIFTTNSTLAGIYGVSPRQSGQPPVTDPTGHYKGILTRALITHQKPSVSGDINPILRGVFLVTNIIGRDLGSPANFAEQQEAAALVPAGASTKVETIIKTSQAQCMSCHAAINPSGFALSHYDSLGRYQTIEKRYNEGGIIKATNPVDASTTLTLNGKSYNISDAHTLVDALIDSGKLYEAFAKYYFNFTFGRAESSAMDRAIIVALQQGLKAGSVKSALQAMALSPAFSRTQAPY